MPPEDNLLSDRLGVSDAITRMLHAVDRRDWATVRRTLADRVRTDYTSLFAAPPEQQSAEALIEMWRASLPGYDATMHLTGPILAEVSGDTARAHCAVTAIHRLGSEDLTVSGHYDMDLIRIPGGWAIASITYHNVLVAGDPKLAERARERVERTAVGTARGAR